MEFYNAKNNSACEKKIVADDMILTKDLPTTAGSKMLEGYTSLFDAEALTRLYGAGYTLSGKASVGEFAIDLVGETSAFGTLTKDEKLLSATAEIVGSGEVEGAITLEVNGATARATAQNGLVSVKPTYGVVSRYGTIPVACSGECVSVTAKCADKCKEILSVIVGHDDKDGTSLPQEKCVLSLESKEIKKVAILTSMLEGADDEVKGKINETKEKLQASGVVVEEISSSVIPSARPAWNILMSSELCNNVSRYDGVKYGYRAKEFSGLDELYTNSRTEAFGSLLKHIILLGSDNLSTENYMKIYDKALRVRRVIVEEFNKIFGEFDAVIMPACSTFAYTEEMVKANPTLSQKENFYTAPVSITGLPAVVANGVQFVGKAFSESAMLDLIKRI